jgi:hypothetical protein
MVIATRLLKIRNATSEHPVQIRISAPEQKDIAWSCGYEIDWPEGVEKRAAWGADSAQAVLLAFQMIGADLYTSSYHKAGKLVFGAPDAGYGFPVPSSLRPFLVGDDAKFQ